MTLHGSPIQRPPIRVSAGNEALGRVLNGLLEYVNAHAHFTGDGEFIQVKHVGSSIIIGFNRDALRTRPHQTLAVRVWRDGGTTDGSKTTQCNRTYTVRTLEATGPAAGGAALGTGMTPQKRRPALGALSTPATTGAGEIGIGYFAAGVFFLYDANEVQDVEACA